MSKKHADEEIEAWFELHFGPPKTPIPLLAEVTPDPSKPLGARLELKLAEDPDLPESA